MNKKVYVIGVFDLFHRGHVEFLKRARSLGSRLVVAVNGDEMVGQYKRKPFYAEEDRLAIIRACSYVDEAFIIHDFDNKRYIEQYEIDIIVHGDDWEVNSYLEQIRVTKEYLINQKVKMVLIPYTSGVSTSQIIQQIRER